MKNPNSPNLTAAAMAAQRKEYYEKQVALMDAALHILNLGYLILFVFFVMLTINLVETLIRIF